jgi:superfamily II DNA or RNA helicase
MPLPLPPPRRGDLVRIRAERWRVERHVAYGDVALVEVTGRDRSNTGQRARFLLPFEPLDRLTDAHTPRVVRPARWRRHARRVLAGAAPDARALRAAANAAAAILPFQLEPALAVAHGISCRLLIADEVGLGKTVQAGLLIAEARRRQPDAHVLIAVPAGLREQWQDELRRRFHLPSLLLDAASLAQARPGLTAGANPWGAHAIVIVSIDYVKRPEAMRAIEALVWDVVVFDEAHTLCSHSERSTAAALLAERARTVVLLSATPHGGDDEAFTRLCGIGSLGDRSPLLLFRRTRHDVGLTVSRRAVWLRVRPTPAERAMHTALLAYARGVWAEADPEQGARLALAVLTRRASSSAASLVRSIERRLAALDHPDDNPPVRQIGLPLGDADAGDEAPATALIAPGLHDTAEECRQLRRLRDVARLAAVRESKLLALTRLLRRTKEPAIVFTEYRDTLSQLAAQAALRDAAQLHGGMTRGDRAAALRRFTTGQTRLLLATDAASEGLNLHERCRLVVHLELPWTPLRLEQRVGRVERIGQRRRVHALHLIAADTGEETVVARLLQRMTRIRRTLDRLRMSETAPDAILRAVLGGPAPAATAAAGGRALPPGVLVPNLRELATQEATRLHAARRLAATLSPRRPPVTPGDQTNESTGTAIEGDSRPVVTAITGRRGGLHCYWTFRHDITDADGQLIWEHLIALHARAIRGAPLGPGNVRALLNPHQPLLARALARQREAALLAVRDALAAPLALALRREHALRDAISARHARLSASLLQPGLFDRRAERAGAAQTAVRDDALARCAVRLRLLGLSQAPASGVSEVSFAVVVGR